VYVVKIHIFTSLNLLFLKYVKEVAIYKIKYNLGSAMLRATSDDMECGMWGDVLT
jgi:hypothetical protein